MALATLLACHPVGLRRCSPQNGWPRVRFGFLLLFGHRGLVSGAIAEPLGLLALSVP